MNSRILIVDDEEGIAKLVAAALAEGGYQCETCASGPAALEAFEHRSADLVITDLKMPRMDGIELMRELHRRRRSLPVILLTGFASIPSAVAAMREGAFDYVTKPFEDEELHAVVSRALEMTRLERENRFLRQGPFTGFEPPTIIAESAPTRELVELIRRVAPRRSTVLIQGESGTGKELVARLIHYYSERVEGPFIAVNCKAFAEGVLESELFGHEKGAFTGAIGARAGCFERAGGGTLFLDEIGEISPSFQAKLLRVLQDGEVMRVGADRPRKVDVRVVAATNRNLREEVGAGRFREDLFFRLNVIPIQLLPLRERREDLIALARYFLSTHAVEVGRPLKFTPAAEAALLGHTWRGNVRELENVVERAVALTEGDSIDAHNLMLDNAIGETPIASEGSLQDYVDHAAALRIRAALKAAGGNRVLAAQSLDIDRSTLYRLMKRLGLDFLALTDPPGRNSA